MKKIRIISVIFMCMCLAFLSLSAQTSTDKPKTQEKEIEKKEPGPTETKAIIEPEQTLDEMTGVFIYKPRGRRDPFWNLLQGKSVNIKREAKEGIAGLLIEELDLEGIVFKSGLYIALFKGPDGRPYDVRVGDNVYDGEVIKIDNNTVVFKRLLTIALGGTKERIITLRLIPEEEAAKQ